MTAVTKALSADNITSTQWIWIYYDNPDTTPADQLKSDVWAIIPESEIYKLNKQSEDYKIKEIPTANSVVIEFTIRNTFSYMVWPIKVYPVLNKYLNENMKVQFNYQHDWYGNSFFVSGLSAVASCGHRGYSLFQGI